jgi:hypothetical protein
MLAKVQTTILLYIGYYILYPRYRIYLDESALIPLLRR